MIFLQFYDFLYLSLNIKHSVGMELKYEPLNKHFKRLPIALAQVKVGNTSENLLNKIRQSKYYLYRPKEITKKYISV